MKVYIAGASQEIERAERAIHLARVAAFEIAFDWPAQVREVGDANPADASDGQRRAWADALLTGVDGCHAFWLLAPAAPTIGAWIEFGRALARGKYTLVSGRGESIFLASALESAADDETGLAMLCAYRQRCSAGGAL